MIALDTNVLVRAVTRDDPAQAKRVEALLGEGRFWLSKTVLLETEWVLRYAYKLGAEVIHTSLLKLVGFPRFEVEDRAQVLQALEWFAQGLDFADALHLAAGPERAHFATFDRGLATRARRLEGTPGVTLLVG